MNDKFPRELIYKGKVGKDLDIVSAKKAAEICMLNSFAVLKSAIKSNLSIVKKCIKITVFINSIELFNEQPEVADGASNLIANIMEPNGKHARSAVSVNALPKNASVEVESIFEISLE